MSFAHAGQWGPDDFIDKHGIPLVGATVEVRLTGGGLAALWSDRTKTVALGNQLPVNVAVGQPGVDVKGNVLFFADPGSYLLAVNGTVIPIHIDPDQADVDARLTALEGVDTTTQAAIAAEAVARTAGDALLIPLTQRAAANGVATLDAGSKIPDGQIPDAVTRDTELATAIAALVASAPGTLDTLNEIATALGNDPNLATTLTAAIAAKVSDTAYNAGTWDGVTTVAPSKNAVRDKIEALTGAYVPTGQTVDARAYGLVADSLRVFDAAITSGTPNLVSLAGRFVPADQGRTISVGGAGAGGVALVTTVLTYVDPSHVTLAANAGTTITSGQILIQRTSDSAGLSAAILAAQLDSALGLPIAVVVPTGAVLSITTAVNVPAWVTLVADGVMAISTVAGAAFTFGSVCRQVGHLTVNCMQTASSGGVLLGDTGSAQHADLDSLEVQDFASFGFKISSTTGAAVSILNQVKRLRVIGGAAGSTAMHLVDTNGSGSNRVNANSFGYVSLQNNLGAVLVNDHADGNYFGFLEAENNLGTGIYSIDLVNGLGFFMAGGWIEGNTKNLRIANDPAVQGVHITAQIDSALNAGDTKFSYTFSNNRAVVIKGKQYQQTFGRQQTESLAIGPYGLAGADQTGASEANFAVAGGMTCYRKSSGTPYFVFKGATAGQGYLFDDGTTTILDMTPTRVSVPVQLQVAAEFTLFRTSQTLASNGAVTFDAHVRTNHRCILNANATSSSITNPTNSQQLKITFRQDGTGGRTYVWPTNCRFDNNVPPSNTTPNTQTSVTFEYDSTALLWLEQCRAVAVPVT